MDRQEKKELIYERIVQALFELLKDNSWEQLSSSDICKRAGVSKRTLYIYFRSQDEMYLAVVKRSFERLGEALRLSTLRETDPNDIILAAGNSYLIFMLENPVEGQLTLNYNEKKYEADYPLQTEAISLVANNFELMSLFKKLQLDPQVYNSTLAIFLWAQIEGLAQLILNKGSWMETHYETTLIAMIEAQMEMVRNFLKGVCT